MTKVAAARTVLDLAEEDGLRLTKKKGASKEEYCGPCPFCGTGNDRFLVWPEQDRYWCRACEKGGDAIQYLRDKRGESFKDACDYLGVSPKDSSLPPLKQPGSVPRIEREKPRKTTGPPELWTVKSAALVEYAEEQLWSEAGIDTVAYLQSRGLTEETIRRHHLGWNPKDEFQELTTWGLPKELNENGRERKLCVPAGIVIPAFHREKVVRIRVRKDSLREGEKNRYHAVKGHESRCMIIGEGPAWVIVESELDAMLLHQEAGDMVGVIALGSAQVKPYEDTAAILKMADVILNSLDSDEAGARQAWEWWPRNYATNTRWPIPKGHGKDPTEAHCKGYPLREWVRSGLALSWTITKKTPSLGELRHFCEWFEAQKPETLAALQKKIDGSWRKLRPIT
jgi:DNA primase